MKTKISVSKIFSFEAAHALDGYRGKCKEIHGHSYKMTVTVRGTPNNNIDNPNCGMVIDFGDVKNIVNERVLPLFDHRLILRDDSRFRGIEAKNEKVRYVPYQPTCENMLLEIAKILEPEFYNKLRLFKLRLQETSTSYAEWNLSYD